jgi:hypothetical protein
MPIKFRCPHCQQFLGISSGRAGAVTDCPMCGRTIRVPDIDGTVRPLPGLELNHLDARLASALDKLAGIGAGRPASEAEEPEQGQESPQIEERPAAARVLPTPLPDPIEIAPAPQPRISEPPPAVPRTVASPPSRIEASPVAVVVAPSAPVDPGSVLAALAAQDVPPRRSQPSRWVQPLALAIGALVGAGLFAAGFVTGQWMEGSQPGTSVAVSPVAPVPEPEGAQAPAATPQPAAALTGRITYVSDSGDSLPDSGARILVLPQERQGTGLLPFEGVRASAAAGDLRVAQAAVRAMGGDLAVADNDGQYSVQLSEPGLYHVVILSRYQPGPPGAAVPPDAAAALQKFFERPSQVTGTAACHVSEFRYRGSGTSPRDHSFERS